MTTDEELVPRDPRTGRVVAPGAAPVPAAGGPDRVGGLALAYAWLLAVAYAGPALVWIAYVVATAPRDPDNTYLAALFAVPFLYRGAELGLRAGSLTWGCGRYVFLGERVDVRYDTNRWYVAYFDRFHRPEGHWVELTEAETGEVLGWVEVPWCALVRLADQDVAAVFGGGRADLRWLVLAGPFAPVRTAGCLRTERPEPASNGLVAQILAWIGRGAERRRAAAEARRRSAT